MRKTKPKFKKQCPQDKLFVINNFKYDNSKMLITVSSEVWQFANEQLGYNITKPKQMESFLRKCFRAYWASKQK